MTCSFHSMDLVFFSAYQAIPRIVCLLSSHLEQAIMIPYLSSFHLAMTCPANSHYEVCTNTCSNHCANITEPCPETCMEGCQCDDGFLSDGVDCIPKENCGCFSSGHYYRVINILGLLLYFLFLLLPLLIKIIY